MLVRTAGGTAIDILGPNRYVRTPDGGVPREHTCLAWGAVMPLDPATARGEGAMLMIPIGPGAVSPVRVLAGRVIPGYPLCFASLDGDGSVRFFVSRPVVEVDGKVATPEGMAGELPDELKRLLAD